MNVNSEYTSCKNNKKNSISRISINYVRKLYMYKIVWWIIFNIIFYLY